MAKVTTEKRRLIKFSNYSMCITLPKWVIDQLEWQKGDQLTLVTDVKSGKITLYKDKAEATPPASSQHPPKTISTKTSEEAPKLRW